MVSLIQHHFVYCHLVVAAVNEKDKIIPLIQHLTMLIPHQSSSQNVLQLPNLSNYLTAVFNLALNYPHISSYSHWSHNNIRRL